MDSFVAAFDVGTTSVKAVLLSPGGALLHAQSVALKTWTGSEGAVEQQPEQWYRALTDIAQQWWQRGIDAASIRMIAMTGQMQNLIAIDRQGAPLGPALLYSDVRASREADSVNLRFGKDALRKAVGNPTTAASLLPKLIYFRQHYPELYSHTHKVLFGAKDYLINALCGKAVCDLTTASTTGLLLLQDRVWYRDLLESFEFAQDLMPGLYAPEQVVGSVSNGASAVTGFMTGTPVICGVGDAAATALGAGAADTSEPYLYVGTTGWVAHQIRSGDAKPAAETVFTLCSPEPDAMIRIAPVLNAGNVLAWALTLLGHTPEEDPAVFYALLDAEAAASGDTEALMFIPYISPERCPIATLASHGAFIGISARTTRAQMLRAVFDGIALSLRWCGDMLDIATAGNMAAIGGGTRSRVFMQAVADAFNTTLHLHPDADLLAAAGAARIAARVLDWNAGLDTTRETATADPQRIVYPDERRSDVLRNAYPRFRQVAEAITALPLES